MHLNISNPAIKAFLIVIFFFVAGSVAFAQNTAWDSAYGQGSAAGKDMQTETGSPDQINKRFSQPMTSGGTAMQTFDGGKSFGSQLTSESTNSFLDIFAGPSQTGDITTLAVKQDTDFDGTPDYAWNLGSPISGVCSNGYISADTGTWDNKRYFVWQADSNGRVSAIETPSMLSLAGCYCINASCGSNLAWTNMDIILKDLGGGIVSAIQTQKNFTITNVSTTLSEIKYYGQATSTAGSTTGIPSSGVTDPSQYYQKGRGTLPGEQEAQAQAADGNSMYAQLNALNNNVGNQYTTQQCAIKRQTQLNPVIEIIGYDVKFYIGYDSDGSSKECFWAKKAGDCMDVWVNGGGWDNCKTVNANNIGTIIHSIIYSGACIPYTDPHSGGTGCFSPPATIAVKSYKFLEQTDCGKSPGCYGSGNNTSHQFWHLRAYTVDDITPYHIEVSGNLVLGIKDSPAVTKTGSCAGLDLTNCDLQQETICDYDDKNCIFTYRNYNSTGLTPYGSCKQMTSPNTGMTWTFCADGGDITFSGGTASGSLESGENVWWNIHKTYTCQNNTIYDFSTVKQRSKTINKSLTQDDTSMSFTDTDGTTITAGLPPRQNVNPCEQSCVVRVAAEDNQASLNGTTADYRTSTSTYKEDIRPCDNGVCPVNTGETMVQDCGCTNYFNRAATMMQVMDNAGKDITCSSSPP